MSENKVTINVKCPNRYCGGILKFQDTIGMNTIKWFKCPHCRTKFCLGAFPKDFDPTKRKGSFSIV